MRLVADPLQELEPGRVPVEHDRLRTVGHEDLLLALRERDHRDARQVERLHRRQHRRQLPLASVDDHEIRCRRERLVVLLVRHVAACARTAARPPPRAPRSRPGPRALDPELPVVRLLRRPRPGRRPSSRPPRTPGCSRCRSTRSAAAAPRGSAPRGAPRAPPRAAAASAPPPPRPRRAPPARSASPAPGAAASRRARPRAPRPATRAAPSGTRPAEPCPRPRAGRRSAAARSAPSRSTRG